MSRNTQDKIQKKRSQWVERTAAIFDVPLAEAEVILSQPQQQSFRINTLKVGHNEVVLRHLGARGWQGRPYDWYPFGYGIDGDKRVVSDSILAAEGAVYVQNAASWLPVLALHPQPGEKILDMCAAPGGKAAHILELTRNQAEVWVNDNSRARMSKMRANFARLGVRPAQLTLYDVTRLAQKLDGEQFDKILLDAPCSGEGMMNLQRPRDLETWSVAHIRRLQSLQKQAVVQAWQLLKPGGTLVYSTCTTAPEENEAVIDYVLRKRAGSELQPLPLTLPNQVSAIREWNGKVYHSSIECCMRLKPSPSVEAFFVAVVHKTLARDY